MRDAVKYANGIELSSRCTDSDINEINNRANGGANKRESNAAVEMAMNRVEDPSNIPLCHH